MKHFYRLLVVGAVCMLLSVLLLPAAAQDQGTGGIIIDGTFGGDPATFNPLLCQDTTCQDLFLFMTPGLVAVDPKTASFIKKGPGAVAIDWTSSEDGKVYTFKLRDDYKWNDGVPVTAADFEYSFNAIASGKLQPNAYSFVLDSVESMKATDPTTLVVTYKQSDCRALANASIPAVPSHIMPKNFEDINTMDWNLNPTVTGGVFKFKEFRSGELVSLEADQTYVDATNGHVAPDGYILKQVPDANVQTEQFLAGETNFIDAPTVSRRADVKAAAQKGDVQVYEYPGNFWDYLAFNLADPKNPQDGMDKNGKPIDQGHHPLFGDKRVRQALARAVDIDAIIKAAVFGNGTRMPSVIIPASWAFDKTLAPIPYDPAAASKMLDQAGFIDDDNNPATPRVAKGAMYAPDGTPFSFKVLINEGNSRRAAEAQLMQDEFKQIGVDMQIQSVDFNTWQQTTNAQTFDAIMLAWQQGYPDDPDQTQLFTTGGDIVGSGSNFTSYDNPTFDDLNLKARTLPGCDQGERAKIYGQMQQIMQDDVPYLWMYAINGMYAARSNVQGFAPYPSQKFWNIDTWTVQTPK